MLNEVVKVVDGQLEMLTEAQLLLKEYEKKIEQLTAERDEIKSSLLNAMLNNDIKKFESDVLSATVKTPVRKHFNVYEFQKKFPELYEEYKVPAINEVRVKDEYGKAYAECCTEEATKPSVTIKYKG